MPQSTRGKEPASPAGFAEFCAASSPSLLRAAWLLAGDIQTAQDLVQDALVKAFVAWPRIREAEALAYTRRIMVNENIDRWRRARQEASTTPDHTSTQASSAMAVVDDRDQIIRMLARLPEQQRKVIVLRYYTDLSEAATAGALGISIGAVKSASSRGLAKLRSIHEIEGASDGRD
ncbi:SigE family RNA polymerase sigma factor [Leekyejoonella antrihumi]|uniref:SigE family RNA polymerase sigma factor n=1 Tax=Leekyejoonella antrihumi TaxID=1660198 RepID=A0A563DQ74_9MICO|nr:SigE family RNA polymerase sigma factor [Leekyejoonella antrihumi]TWP32448.1 SigE family RNA polymerase sigma factor [Leekyejoonella antrihumi]